MSLQSEFAGIAAMDGRAALISSDGRVLALSEPGTEGAVVLTMPEAPDSPMLNRVLGLGVERPATEADVDEALAAVPAGVTFYVAVAAGARPAELPRWLATERYAAAIYDSRSGHLHPLRYCLGLAAAGRFVHVWVDRATQRPVRVPEPIRVALAPLRVDDESSG